MYALLLLLFLFLFVDTCNQSCSPVYVPAQTCAPERTWAGGMGGRHNWDPGSCRWYTTYPLPVILSQCPVCFVFCGSQLSTCIMHRVGFLHCTGASSLGGCSPSSILIHSSCTLYVLSMHNVTRRAKNPCLCACAARSAPLPCMFPPARWRHHSCGHAIELNANCHQQGDPPGEGTVRRIPPAYPHVTGAIDLQWSTEDH